MPCCMVERGDLGRPPQWLMRLFVRRVIAAVAEKESLERGEVDTPEYDLPDDVVDLIGHMSGLEVTKDPPSREGCRCFKRTNEK